MSATSSERRSRERRQGDRRQAAETIVIDQGGQSLTQRVFDPKILISVAAIVFAVGTWRGAVDKSAETGAAVVSQMQALLQAHESRLREIELNVALSKANAADLARLSTSVDALRTQQGEMSAKQSAFAARLEVGPGPRR